VADDLHWQRWRLLITVAVLGVGGIVAWILGARDQSACTEAWAQVPSEISNPADAGSSYERAEEVCSDEQFRDEVIEWGRRHQETP